MPKSAGDKIGQAEYATLYTEATNILGTPVDVTDDANAYGWDQTSVSSNVSVGDKVTAADWNNLRTDIISAYEHITNSTSPSPAISLLNAGDDITATQYNNMETISTFNYTNRFTAHSTHLTSATGLTATQTATWNGQIILDIVATWSSLNNKLAFWNAGGIMRYSVSGANSSGSDKDEDWLGALNGAGTTDLKANGVTTTGPANTVNSTRDFYYLYLNQTVAQTLVQLNLSDVNPAYSVYDENWLRFNATDTSDTQMTFTITVNDVDTGDQTGLGPPEDEDVTVDVTGTLTVLTPNSNVVTGIETPTFSSGGWV